MALGVPAYAVNLRSIGSTAKPVEQLARCGVEHTDDGPLVRRCRNQLAVWRQRQMHNGGVVCGDDLGSHSVHGAVIKSQQHLTCLHPAAGQHHSSLVVLQGGTHQGGAVGIDRVDVVSGGQILAAVNENPPVYRDHNGSLGHADCPHDTWVLELRDHTLLGVVPHDHLARLIPSSNLGSTANERREIGPPEHAHQPQSAASLHVPPGNELEGVGVEHPKPSGCPAHEAGRILIERDIKNLIQLGVLQLHRAMDQRLP
mmetsp:Transcript_6967/g.17156  ORF Transcript_6967/g.17156 Transcript_6967/m.17156 type:complete len:257 (-) Transcript_6967:32-802(-)